MILILSVLSVISVNTKINVVGSKDTLAVRVGHNIRARMGKEGIELEKIRDSEENKLRELLEVSLNKGIYLVTDNMTGKDTSMNDDGDVDNKEDQKRGNKKREEDEQRFEMNYT